MECSNPSYLKNGIMYHWSNPFDQKGQLIFPAQKIDCRKCIHCRKNRGKELALACTLEAQEYKNNYFITLTKRPEYREKNNKFDKKEIKNFIKKIQRWCKKEQKPTPKIYRVHEHGKLGGSHYHIIAFNLNLDDVVSTPRPDTYHSRLIEEKWGHGHITVQDVNYATAMYQSLYLDKDLKNGHANSDKKSVSWHSGIGTKSFLKNFKQWLTLGYIPMGDQKMKIPRKFMRIAQKHYDALTLTNEQFCFKYSKKHTKKIINGETTKLCQINIEPNQELALYYQHYKNKERDETKNETRMNQITQYIYGERKLKPDFHLSGENSVHNQKQQLKGLL